MFKFFKEIKESFKEGIEEAKAESIAESEAKEEISNRVLSQEIPDIENIALALSCPFRETLTAGDNLRLFAFGQIEEKEKQSFKKLLYRDFEIQDEESMKRALHEMDNLLPPEGFSNNVFRAAISIYIITSSVDLGFITFADYKEQCKKNIEEITMNETIDSWEAFAEQFMEGECINNALGRKFLQSSIKKLLKEKDSPWVIFPWHKIVSKVEKQKNSYGTKDMSTSLLDNVLWMFSTEKITDKENFSRQVQQYQKDIRTTDHEWTPDKEVLEEAKVFLLYEAWIKGIGDLLPNEELAEEEDFAKEDAADGYFQVEIFALLEADNHCSFTTLELLMKVHNQQHNKELGDHIFFEGLERTNPYKSIPVYYVNCGS